VHGTTLVRGTSGFVTRLMPHLSLRPNRSSVTGGSVIVFPAHALLIVEERLREQESEGVRRPDGMALDELALRVLIAAALTPGTALQWRGGRQAPG
jgi:hypothetical protein